MSYGITAEDMVGICLVLAEGNVMLSMEDVILKAEEFQEIKKIHFGVGYEDFRNCIIWLGIENDLYKMTEVVKIGELPNPFKLPLLYWLPLILSFHAVCFNDEGESWQHFSEDGIPDNRRYVHSFIAEIVPLTPDKIMARLDRLGFDRDYLSRYTENGCSLVDDDKKLPFEKPHWSIYPSHCLWSHLGVALQEEKEPQPKKDYFVEFSKSGVKIKVVDSPQKSKKTS
jgi:hypothetical protein